MGHYLLDGDEARHSLHCLSVRLLSVSLRTSHRQAVKRIIRYLHFTPELGLWYSLASTLSLHGFSDVDFVGCRLDRKLTFDTCQFLGSSLVSWSSHKQSSVAQSTTKPSMLLPLAIALSCFG